MCSHSNIQLIILIIKYLIQFYPPLGRIGPNEVSGCPNRLSGASGEPGYGGGGYGAAGESAGRCRDASLRGLRTGRRRRSFRGGGEAAGWGERVCRCGEWGLGGCRAARFKNGAMVVQFPGRRCFRAETRRWAGVRVGCPFRVICPEGALRSTLPYGAGCAVRGRRVLCHGAEGRSGSGKENWTATGCSGRLIGRQGPHIGGGE